MEIGNISECVVLVTLLHNKFSRKEDAYEKKNRITAGVSLLLCFSITFPSVASENEVSGYSRNISGIQMESENYDETVQQYDIPKEVAEYIADVFAENENAEVTVFAPAEKMNTRASYGSWSEPRTYKGYTLKDWIVEVENAFGMTDIASGSKAYSFAETICAYMGNALLDSFIPFGSATTTLYEFICANNTTVAASGGDKAYAAPMYTSYTKFTYVSIDGNQILGARTQKAKLETIMWYYYFDTIHEQKSAKQSYNRWIYTSAYSKPDEKAITWATSGGYIENTIAVRIGDKDFVLE